MKVFISWSGERSKILAQVLRKQLPLVIQEVDPFMSENDIVAGELWSPAILGELNATDLGLICITPENRTATWINFEAGALSKAISKARVVPLVYDMALADVAPPLGLYQAKPFDHDHLFEVLEMLNGVAQRQMSREDLSRLFDLVLWPDVQQTLEKMPPAPSTTVKERDQREVLNEILEGVRELGSSYSSREVWSVSSLPPLLTWLIRLVREVRASACCRGWPAAARG